MADLVDALHTHPHLLVIRCKNRFDPNVNTSDAGGYRDFQTLCLFKFGGRHHYVEVQLNLIEMVAIKAGNGAVGKGGGGVGGGHDAFNTARVIDAFSKRSTEYRGNPTPELWAMIASGSVLRVILDGAVMTENDVVQLGKAIESKQSRVNYLSTKKIKPGGAILGGALMAAMLNQNAEEPHVLDLSGWHTLTELPDLSRLLATLKIANLPKHLFDWDTRGYTAYNFMTDVPTNFEDTKTLDFGKVFGKHQTKLPEWLSKLTNLTVLNLNGCEKLTVLPKGLSQLKNLTTLDLRWCEKLTALPEGLSKLTNLTNLHLRRCKKLTELPDLSQTKFMRDRTELNFGEIFGTKHWAKLPEWLSKLTTLTYLDLSGCKKLVELPEGLRKLTNLVKLDLTGCSSLTALPKGLSKLANLTNLDLGWCEKLAEPFPDLSHLKQNLDVGTSGSASNGAKIWGKRGLTSTST